MKEILVTVDIDWASEPVIEETLDFLKERHIFPTVFTTHRSPRIEASLEEMEVGLHPYFDPSSSHGATIPEVVQYITSLSYNLPAFRCHRFGNCNQSRQAMQEAGMIFSSNTCTDLEIVAPFKDRFGLLEVPIFFEDGGYLWKKYPLELTLLLKEKMEKPGLKVLLIHPMHFVLNTPNFSYMTHIKKSMNRQDWNQLNKKELNELRWKGRGIKDLLIELFDMNFSSLSFKQLYKRWGGEAKIW